MILEVRDCFPQQLDRFLGSSLLHSSNGTVVDFDYLKRVHLVDRSLFMSMCFVRFLFGRMWRGKQNSHLFVGVVVGVAQHETTTPYPRSLTKREEKGIDLEILHTHTHIDTSYI
jgi:hypothetical protein